MIVGTAGHIDHGKTALVKALTGVDADRLAEEKARGITIELGFAYADLGAGSVTGFVDVPGHEKFVHTMLAGAGGIDLALLVVAADDGIMPQTREHLAILDLLGIRRGMVALTKSDLAGPERLAALRAEIAELLAPTGLDGAPVFPVSSLTGAGIPALRDALARAEAETAARATGDRFRMAIDRSFTLAGAGTVVTGTVLSGRVATGDQVTLSPSGLPARVRGIHAQNRKADQGLAGQRCALNLAGEAITREAIHRGDLALDPVLHAPTQRIDVTLRVLAGEPKPLATWFPARLHLGAAETGARIVPLQGPLGPGKSGLAQIVLDRPVAAAFGERFILRDTSARRTIGGGEMIKEVRFDGTVFNEGPHKFEAGTPNIAGFVGLGAAVDYLSAIGMDNIATREQALLAHATEELGKIDGLRTFGSARDKASVISFAIAGTHSHDLATLLDLEGVAVRSGQHCAHPLLQWLGVGTTCRASLAFYNTHEEIERFITALRKVRRLLA